MITSNPDLVYLDPEILSSASSELENRLEQLQQINSLPTEHRKRNDLNQVEKVVARLADLGIGSMFTISTTYGTLLKGIKWLLRDSKKTDLENYLEGGIKRFLFGNATTSRYGYDQIKTIVRRSTIKEFGDDLIRSLSNQSNSAGKFAKVGRGLGFLTKMAIRKFPLLALAASVGSWLYMNNPEFLKGFKDALPSLKTVKEMICPGNIGVLFD
jgi:hypothetical protein